VDGRGESLSMRNLKKRYTITSNHEIWRTGGQVSSNTSTTTTSEGVETTETSKTSDISETEEQKEIKHSDCKTCVRL
jgi:hypothetical protein